MLLRTRRQNWILNYKVAALGAYATIFVEAVYLILGGFRNASPLVISILTNGSAVILAGSDGPRALSSAAIRISATMVFLLASIVTTTERENFDGTAASLCSVAHLIHQCSVQRKGWQSSIFLQQTEEAKDKHEEDRDHGYNSSAANFSRHLIFQFGNDIKFDGGHLLFLSLGNVAIYRIFDFDLGFGLLFASFSLAPCAALLLLVNWAQLRGRQVKINEAIQKSFARVFLLSMPISFIFFSFVDMGVDIAWWKPAFGAGWLSFLLSTLVPLIRFFVHVTFFPCTACRGTNGRLQNTSNDSRGYCTSTTASAMLTEDDVRYANQSTLFYFNYSQNPKVVERFWLNDEAFFQVNPKTLVLTMGLCWALAVVSVNAENLTGYDYDQLSSGLSNGCRLAVFYVIITFTLVSSGHNPVQSWPNALTPSPPSILNLDNHALKAALGTALLHAANVTTQMLYPSLPVDLAVRSLIPLICVGIAPLLLVGISRVSTEPDDVIPDGAMPTPSKTLLPNKAIDHTAKASHQDASLVCRSFRIEHLDLRLLAMCAAAAMYGLIFHEEIWPLPISCVVFMLMTAMLIYWRNAIPRSRHSEPWLLCCAATIQVCIFSHYNFLNLFAALYDETGSREENLSRPLSISLWYAVPLTMLLVDSQSPRITAEQNWFTTVSPSSANPVLLRFPFILGVVWQLKNSQLTMTLAYAVLSSLFRSSLALPVGIIIGTLAMMIFVLGFRRQYSREAEKSFDAIRLAASVCATVTACSATQLKIYGLLQFEDNFTLGSSTAFLAYCAFPMMLRHLSWLKET